jgi:predicted MFS family arabinose efflux permease
LVCPLQYGAGHRGATLTSIGSSFTVSDGVAGLMMTMPGFLAAIAAPLVTAATARFDRRLTLCIFMLLPALANFLAAAAPVYWLVLTSRIMVGITIGGFWSIGVGSAERLVPPPSVGRATAVIFSAVPLGSVLGVPAGTSSESSLDGERPSQSWEP